MAYDTVANIVSDAAVELGLGAVSDVFASTDQNVVQLRGLLKSVGQSLVGERQWSQLQTEATITTRTLWAASTAYVSSPAAVVANGLYYYTCAVSGTSASSGGPTHTTGNATDGTVTWTYVGRAADFSLPTDFEMMIDQTGWNRTSTLPLNGPLSPQSWQYLKARSVSGVLGVSFRPVQGILRLYPDEDITAGLDIRYEYISSYWISNNGIPSKSAPTINADVIMFDRLLMVRALKLEFLRAKGFPSQAAQEDYDKSLEAAISGTSSARILNVAGRNRPFDPLIGGQSIPITGFGS